MCKITIFYGPYHAFNNLIPKDDFVLLPEFVYKQDAKNRIYKIDNGNQNEEIQELKDSIRNLVAFSEDYSSLNEHAIQSFVPIILSAEINHLYLQNPPYSIYNQLNKKFGKSINVIKHEYAHITLDFIKKINSEFSNHIVGQEEVKLRLLSALYPLVNKKRNKKVKVLMFYGPSGVGKTETAKFLSSLLNEKLFREQMSMYQNSEFQSYLFGGKHSQDSFAKRLCNRKSNVILLDEFDKCNPIFHSAFYQLFDEGEFRDKNYRIELNNSIIICTSNYLTKQDININLGDPLFSRFDAVIEFKELALNDKEVILKREFEKQLALLPQKDKKFLDENVLWEKINYDVNRMNNIRQMKTYIIDLINSTIIRKRFIS